MATKKVVQPERGPLELKVSRDEARQQLEDRMQKGRELRGRQVADPVQYEALGNDYEKWNKFNQQLLKNLFTTDEIESEYSHWSAMFISTQPKSLGQKIADRYDDIEEKVHRLDSIAERLEIIPLTNAAEATAIQSPSRYQSSAQSSKKVFIVHGRDEVAKTSLEVFAIENGLEPVVLHRQADEGMTIIEKFEKHSDVGYAFILLTPDEVAYLAAEEAKPDGERKKEFRARPNVIFEFGYFVGKLGRSKVCCLYTGGVSLPSDVSGMIYKAYNQSIEEVGYSIIKDLKAAGFKLS